MTGVTLHRQKSIHPFADLDGPLVDLLFSITRPSPKKKKLDSERELAKATPPSTYVAPKGMVSYRRELYGEGSKPEKPS